MKKIKLLGIFSLVIIGLPALAILLVTKVIDPNGYRPDIAQVLTQKLGRKLSLDGTLSFGFSFSRGLTLSVENASLANPAWASRPDLAKIAHLSLGLSIRRLLSKQVEITSLDIDGADIQLEKTDDGQINWALKNQTNKPETEGNIEANNNPGDQGAEKISVDIDHISIHESHFTFLPKNGKAVDIAIESLEINPSGENLSLAGTGNFMGNDFRITLDGGALRSIAASGWPFTLHAAYANYQLQSSGALDLPKQRVSLDNYEFTCAGGTISGQMRANWAGRLALNGSVKSEKFIPADFSMPTSATTTSIPTAALPEPQNTSRGFSTAPLNLSVLNAVDARFDIAIGELATGKIDLRQIETTLSLANGQLELQPLRFAFDGGQVSGQIGIDAQAAPLHLNVKLNAQQVDLAQISRPDDAEKSILSGHADGTLIFAAAGYSPHDLASQATGVLNIVNNGGAISTKILGKSGNKLLGALSPDTVSSGKTPLNCLVARFRIGSGALKGNGLLGDSALATLSGQGEINFMEQTIDIIIHGRLKNLKVDQIDLQNIAPAMHIDGSLSRPRFTADSSDSVAQVAGLLLGKKAAGKSDVPFVTAISNQNACVAALDHPQAAPAPSSPDTASAKQAGKNILKSLRNLFRKNQ